MATKKLTNQEKILYAGGTILILGGGVLWYLKNKKDKELEQQTTYNESLPNVPSELTILSPKKPLLATPSIIEPKASVPVRTNETFYFPIGQEVMANGFYGTQTYVAKRKADGNFISYGEKHVKFNNGDPIGKIIWVGKMTNGTYRYVVERKGTFGKLSYHWIADTQHIAPIGKMLPVVKPYEKQLDSNKILKRGVKGDEVVELQKRLKITADGDFGKNTEKALLQQKKVSQISLKNW